MPFPAPAFRRAVRQQSESVTVHRRDDTTGSNYGEEITYSQLSNNRDVFFGGVEETQQPTSAGENQSKRLVAYTEDNIDLQVNDRVDYGGSKYEVLTKTGHPSESNPSIYRYELDDV